MKTIEIDDDLYKFIAAQTKHIGESASDILRRLLMPESPRPVVTDNQNLAPEKRVDEPQEDSSEADTQLQSNPGSGAVDDQAMLLRVSTTAINTYTKRVDQFLFILCELYRHDPDAFSAVEQIKGKNRTYFATSKAQLLENGSSTNPKAIPESPYWVVTNNNTAKKVAMLEQVLQVLGYSEQTIRIITDRFAPQADING